MIGRRAVVGLSLLSALLFCAFAAQSASAALTTSKNTTAFTCVEGATKDFKDSHCDEAVPVGEGKFGHQAIALNTTTEVDLTNTTNAVFKTEVVGGGKVTITCTVVKNIVKNSTMHNVEPEKGQHTLTGPIETEFSKCTVSELKNCVVEEPIIFKATVHGVEGMEGPNKEANAMGLEFIGDGEKEVFAEIGFIGEKCPVKTPTIFLIIKGKMIATGGPLATSKQDRKASGATLVFTNANAMEELTSGGKPVTITGTLTMSMAGGGNPISLTTTT